MHYLFTVWSTTPCFDANVSISFRFIGTLYSWYIWGKSFRKILWDWFACWRRWILIRWGKLAFRITALLSSADKPLFLLILRRLDPTRRSVERTSYISYSSTRRAARGLIMSRVALPLFLAKGYGSGCGMGESGEGKGYSLKGLTISAGPNSRKYFDILYIELTWYKHAIYLHQVLN